MNERVEQLATRDAPSGGDAGYHRGVDGIFRPDVPVTHRDDEYDPAGFDRLIDMQSRHFWYLGRHRFIKHAVRRFMQSANNQHAAPRSAVDLGGGTGGWVLYAGQNLAGAFSEWALADSSIKALEMAGTLLPQEVRRYQIDLLNLHWRNRWDAAFLLDVLEHIPQHVDALKQIHAALRPGGLLFVTVPALKSFWSYNDVLAGHQRRYSRADFAALARQAGLELLDARYFMFLLSPLYFLSRLRQPNIASMSAEEIRALVARTHRVPSRPVNALLHGIFAAETPAGHWLRWPWGTSLLGVFRKP